MKKEVCELKKSHDKIVSQISRMNNVVMSFSSALAPKEKTRLLKKIDAMEAALEELKRAITSLE